MRYSWHAKYSLLYKLQLLQLANRSNHYPKLGLCNAPPHSPIRWSQAAVGRDSEVEQGWTNEHQLFQLHHQLSKTDGDENYTLYVLKTSFSHAEVTNIRGISLSPFHSTA